MTIDARSCVLFLILCAAPIEAMAQNEATAHNAAQHSFTATAGLMDFDLSGTGQTWSGAIRATRALSDHVALEVGASFAKPEQDFGPSTFIAPEAHLQYHWRIGRVRPFAGGGIGFSHLRANLAINDTAFTWSGAGGARLDLSARVSLLAEMRVRGIEVDFAGSTAEWLGGVTWRLGS